MKQKRRALITGVTGQDGAYLAEFLLRKGYKVYGTYRRLSTPNFWRLQALEIYDKVNFIPVDLIDSGSLLEAVKIAAPEEIYHLAAQSFVGASFEEPVCTGEITGLGTGRLLETIRAVGKDIRFYQASTSELYGNSGAFVRRESSPFEPSSPYAAAKLYAFWMTRIYREAYGLFACNGILFNHESPLRGLEFVTRKISNAVARIALKLQKVLYLGNLDSKRDWGYAPEFVESMWRILQIDRPDDYVIATNEVHSVREFVVKAFEVVGLDWRRHVKVNRSLLRPLDVEYLQGDITKARRLLRWRPRMKFDQLVETMVRADLSRWERYLKGEVFPWDALNYQTETRFYSRSTALRK